MTTDRIGPLRPAARAASLARDAAPEMETAGFVATVIAPASKRAGAVAASVRASEAAGAASAPRPVAAPSAPRPVAAPSELPARPQRGARAASCAVLG
jgi:hypothetical protein